MPALICSALQSVFTLRSLRSAFSLIVGSAVLAPTLALAATSTSPQSQATQSSSLAEVFSERANQAEWLLADRDDHKKPHQRDRDDDDDDDDDDRRPAIQHRGWRANLQTFRLVNTQQNVKALVLQLNILDKPPTSYANVVYQVFMWKENRWVAVYTNTGARLISKQGGKVIVKPEVINLEQLRLGANVDLSTLRLRTVVRVKYDVQGQRDVQFRLQEIYNYSAIAQITNISQITTTTTTGVGQTITLQNGFRITFRGVSYSGNQSTWRYYMEELPVAQDLSNWVLGLPTCVQVLGVSPKGEFVNPDPNAKIRGIKWQPGGGFPQGEFSVTLNGRWQVGTIAVAAKGPDVARGSLAGPSCQRL